MISQDLFLNLMDQFLERQLDVNTFCEQFIELWTRNRDAIYAKKLTWSNPHDEELIKAFQGGEITEEQFTKQWRKLWGTEDTEPLQNMIDAVHSACNIFRPSPTLSWELDEDELRQEVARELIFYRSRQKRS